LGAEWNDFIEEDINEHQWIIRYLEQLSSPFGFFKAVEDENKGRLSADDLEDIDQQAQGSRYRGFEDAVTARFD